MNYIFGYGSLIDIESRRRTTPDAGEHVPVVVRGVERGWWMPGSPVGYSTTFLAIRKVSEPAVQCNGVIYEVSDDELSKTDQREGIYERVAIDYSDIECLAASSVDEAGLKTANIWAYVLPEGSPVKRASARYPIVQSYVDICLSGCFAIEDTFPRASDVDFARLFVNTTVDWSRYWVNDRLFPRRSFVNVPRAFQIDFLLHEELGEIFDQVPLEPARWD